MPSTTPKMARTMAGAANNPQFAAKMGIPTRVAKDFNAADAKTGILRKKRRDRKELTAKGGDGMGGM